MRNLLRRIRGGDWPMIAGGILVGPVPVVLWISVVVLFLCSAPDSVMGVILVVSLLLPLVGLPLLLGSFRTLFGITLITIGSMGALVGAVNWYEAVHLEADIEADIGVLEWGKSYGYALDWRIAQLERDLAGRHFLWLGLLIPVGIGILTRRRYRPIEVEPSPPGPDEG